MKIVKLDDVVGSFDAADYDAPFVIPTETVYGLAARIDSDDALRSIYTIKGRPSDNPLIVHISSAEMLKSMVDGDIPQEYHALMDRFWPGALTLIFRCSKHVSPLLRGDGVDSVAVRMPKHPALRALINRIGVPLAAPSANTSGKPSPTRLEHVIDDLGESVGLYIDGGPCEIGLESTVFGILGGRPMLLRPGGVTKEEIENVLKRPITVKNTISGHEAVVCPGQKYRHYSPSIPVYLFKGDRWAASMHIQAEALAGQRIGLMHVSGVQPTFSIYAYFDLGSSPPEWSRNIFSGLRELDGTCDVIFVRAFSLENEGLAIMDRLEKAATFILE